MSNISGEVGQHKISFNVSAGDSAMVQKLIDEMGWNSTNEEVLTIDNVTMSKNNKYSDVVTVEITYSIKKEGKASITGSFAGIEIGGNAISTSDKSSSAGTDSKDNKGEGASKSGDQAKGSSKDNSGKSDSGQSGKSKSDNKSDQNASDKNRAKDAATKNENVQVYELDESIARMLTQTSKEVVQNDKETLKVKDTENNTGPATAAGALGICIGGIVAERIRFRKKL